jgi:hypothetical protein
MRSVLNIVDIFFMPILRSMILADAHAVLNCGGASLQPYQLVNIMSITEVTGGDFAQGRLEIKGRTFCDLSQRLHLHEQMAAIGVLNDSAAAKDI